MITADELEFLLNQIAELEATVQEQAEQIDFLMRERAVDRGGAKALVEELGSNLSPISVVPPGHGLSAAGQLVLTDHTKIYPMMWGRR